MKGRAGVMLALVAMSGGGRRIDGGGGLLGPSPHRRRSTPNGTLKIGIITPLTGGAGSPRTGAAVRGRSTRLSKLAEAARPEGTARSQQHAGRTGPRRGSGRRAEDHHQTRVPRGGRRPGHVRVRSRPTSDALDRGQAVAHISPSAAQTSLTYGSEQRRQHPRSSGWCRATMCRARHDANFMVDQLKAKKVGVVDFQEPYSVGLARGREGVLKARGSKRCRLLTSVRTTRLLVARDQESRATRTSVFLPRQLPHEAAVFGKQLPEQGMRATIFGGDGSKDFGAVKLRRSVRLELRARHQEHWGIEGRDRRMEEGPTEGDITAPLGRRPTSRRRSRWRRSSAPANRGWGHTEELGQTMSQARAAGRVPNSILGGTFRFSKMKTSR